MKNTMFTNFDALKQEAKDLVDAAPKEVLMQVNKKTADEAKEKLTAAGATVELK